MKTLIINPGSSSVRYSLYGDKEKEFSIILDNKSNGNLMRELGECKPEIVCIRVVAPGTYFQEHRAIDNVFINKLETVKNLAPLHINSVLNEIKTIKKRFPQAKLTSASDSNFHKTQQSVYPLPKKITDKYDLKRFGYHGLSMSSVLRNTNLKNIIICHLGGGTSVAYITNGKSKETSMGFTPLEGLIGGTRSGNIDPKLVLYLIKRIGKEKTENILNEQSGLKALSGFSDMRDIISKRKYNALDFYCQQIKGYIGDYIAKYGKPQAIVFTGAIGFGSPIIRAQICENLEHLGITLNKKANSLLNETKNGEFQGQDSDTKLIVIKAKEDDEMFRIAKLFS